MAATWLRRAYATDGRSGGIGRAQRNRILVRSRHAASIRMRSSSRGRRGLEEYRPDRLWVFAYGSLIWNPEFEFDRTAACAGAWLAPPLLPDSDALAWHAGTAGSDAGARSRRNLRRDRIPARRTTTCTAQIVRLLKREIDANPPTNVPRWINVMAGDEKVRALAFVASPSGPAYAGRRSLSEVAHVAGASGRPLGLVGTSMPIARSRCSKSTASAIATSGKSRS